MPKRVVTGQREDGTSYLARVDELEQDYRGIGSYRVWAVDGLDRLRLPYLGQKAPIASSPTEESAAEALRNSPPQPRAPGEFRVSLHRMAAGSEHAAPFMHWHNTFDLQWLIEGELAITLDGGETVWMKSGDVVVQHGTNHGWKTGPAGAVMGVFMYGAERTGVRPPAEDELKPTRWDAERSSTDAEPPPLQVQSSLPELLGRSPRRIVTGQREDGSSVFARLEEAEEDERTTTGGHEHGVIVHRMWANDRLMPIHLPFLDAIAPLESQPTAEATPEALRTSSPHAGIGGLRVSLIKFLPNDGGRQFGLHWHDTLDVQWLFAGDLTLGLDDGSEVELQPGDAVIQHGTNHTWRSGPEGAVVGLVMLGVERQGLSPPPTMRLDQTPAGFTAGRATS